MSHSDTGGRPRSTFTAEDVAKQIEEARREAIEQARQEERDKLYAQSGKADERVKTMEAEIKWLRQAERRGQKEVDRREPRPRRRARPRKTPRSRPRNCWPSASRPGSRSSTEIQREQNEKMAEIAQQQELQKAMWEKEREMANLAIYIRDRVEAERDNIAPELLDFIDGNTKEEVDASIERREGQDGGHRRGNAPGAGRTAGRNARRGAVGRGDRASHPGLDTGDQTLTAEDIKGMSMKDFAALRQKTGMGGARRRRASFGIT